MIDIHCHLLPGVDDGAADLEVSSQMLQIAAESGTSSIVATPHSDLRYRFQPERCRELIEELMRLHPSGPIVTLGCEVHLTPENIAEVSRNPATFTLNSQDCLLLELPDDVSPQLLDSPLEALKDAGLRVIIAHPERNRYIQRNQTYADGLVEAGIYLQVTALSLEGGFGSAAQKTANYILNRRLAHFVASDAHSSRNRKPGLGRACHAIAERWGEAAAQTLCLDNPKAALAGGLIADMPPASGWLTSLITRRFYELGKRTIPSVP